MGDAPVELEEQHAGCGAGRCVQFHRGELDGGGESGGVKSKNNPRLALLSTHDGRAVRPPERRAVSALNSPADSR